MAMKVPALADTSPRNLPVSVARQAIYGTKLDIRGYEIFFRADHGTTLVEFAESELQKVAPHHPAFINVTEEFILDGHCDALPKDRVVLEILEDVEPNPRVLGELGRLSALGYRIALDDFVYKTQSVPLVQLADIIKIDLLSVDSAEARDLVTTLRPFGAQLLAEKIETSEILRFALDLGCEYLQGNYLSPSDRLW